jgi:excisionase family DNA binding protein
VGKEPGQRAAARRKITRLSLSKTEAAQALGVSVDFLEAHVLGELRVVRAGRRVLIPISELERWLAEHGERLPPG